MATVSFKDLVVHDDRLCLTQETSLKRTLGFAGIHDTSALDWISEAFDAGLSLVSDCNLEDEEGTWTAGGVLRGTGGGAAQWYRIRHTTEVELGFVAQFSKTGNRGGFVFCSDDDYNCYMAWWTGTAVGFSQFHDDDVETVLTSVPLAETGMATVTVAAWPRAYTSVDKIDDLAMAIWFDRKLLVSHVMQYDEMGKKTGFAVYQSDTITFDNYSIPQLHQIVEWTSVDPGESASAGAGRTMGQDQIRLQARYNGAVKIWRQDATATDWTPTQTRPLEVRRLHQFYSADHFRIVGAVHEIDSFRDNAQGHIFTVGNDPNALTEDETEDRGARLHKQAAENADQITIRCAPNPLLEPEDIIELDGDQWRVTQIAWQIAWQGGQGGGEAPVLESTITARRYLAS